MNKELDIDDLDEEIDGLDLDDAEVEEFDEEF